MTLAERFWVKVDKNGPLHPTLGTACWVWTGRHLTWGYGQIENHLTHRLSWRLHNGPIPNRLQVLHRCDNPPCVNPAHLFLGTNTDNRADSKAKGRMRGRFSGMSACINGHPLDAQNTRILKSGDRAGKRTCAICRRDALIRHRALRRIEIAARRRELYKIAKEAREAAGIFPPPRRNPLRERTCCAAGHPYTPENTRMAYGKRICRECRNARRRSPEFRKKQAAKGRARRADLRERGCHEPLPPSTVLS
jgi:hypothetical protein